MVTLPRPATEDGHSQSSTAAVSAQQLQMLREEMQMEHSNLVQAVRVMEMLLRDEVSSCKEAVKQEAMLVEKHLENQLGLMRTELFSILHDLRLALEGSGADLSSKFPMEKQGNRSEAALEASSSGRPVVAPLPASLSPLTEEPHGERLARLDEAIEREVAMRADMDRRLQKEMADLSHQLRMAVALGMEDPRCKVLLGAPLQLQEPEKEARGDLSSGGRVKDGELGDKDASENLRENLREVSDAKDFGFGRLQSLLQAQKQQQQHQHQPLISAAVLPVVFPPAMTDLPPAKSLTADEGHALSVGLLQEQEDLRRAGAVCEAVRHEALRDLLDHGSRGSGNSLRQYDDLGSRP